jgi:pyrroline-5-carboxylate reductase
VRKLEVFRVGGDTFKDLYGLSHNQASVSLQMPNSVQSFFSGWRDSDDSGEQLVATADTIGTVGFLGAGQMATALAKGWIAAGLLTPNRCKASDPYPDARLKFQQATGATADVDNRSVVRGSNVLILAVKPQSMPALLEEVRCDINEKHLIVSIAAGLSIAKLTEMLHGSYRVVRVMPNTPCLIGASATGLAAGPAATKDDAALVERLFNAVGKAFALPENLLDAVTGLSGSGPAFVYVMIESLSDGGVRMGLPREVATALAVQTVLGAARMVQETKQHTSILKDAVTSPGGTTIAGLQALEKAAFRAAIIDAVEAATKRSTELGK